MINELIPHIDATYRTIADRKARCIEGFSMGGRGSTNLAMKHPQLFGSLFNQSGNVYHVSDAANLPNAYLGDDPQRLRDNDAFLNLTKNLDFEVKHDGEWHEMKLRIDEAKTLHALRLDPFGGEGQVKIEGLTLKAADGKVLATWPARLSSDVPT